MKVIQILPELNGGGVERGTLELGRFLVKKGHESLVVSNGGRMVAGLEEGGSRHIALPVHKKRLGSLRQVRVLRKLFQKEKPDILHLRSRLPAWLAWLAWRKMDPETRPRLVTTVHGFYSVNRYSAVMTFGEKVICVSDSVKDYVLRNYPKVPPEKLTVIHRGVDPEQYPFGYRPSESWLNQWYRDFPETREKFLLTLPGRITRLKGHEDLIQMIAALPKDQPIHAVIAGGAEAKKVAYLAELKDMAQKQGISDRLTFAGHRSDMKEVLALSDVVLSLSQKPESFGRTTLEALCLGKAVIGYDHGGVGEILRHLFPQGLIPFGDLAALQKTLQAWVPQPPRPNPENPFTLEKMLVNTLASYEEIVAGRT
ncbi:MAG: glycosyltransferase family 4 protein [Opitutales bacterium]|nr:glycosyltransferase family 4 protein [Opitutales bacterium]